MAAKYVFVRILRNSDHLQQNTFVHWGFWLGINLALGTCAYIVAEAVPILNYLLGLAGALVFAPFRATGREPLLRGPNTLSMSSLLLLDLSWSLVQRTYSPSLVNFARTNF